MPDEIYVEVLKDFSAVFYDISKQEARQDIEELKFQHLASNVIGELKQVP